MRFEQIDTFNRYTLTYSADAAVKGTLTYYVDDALYSEDFFLEAGQRKEFRCLIDGYLAGKLAKAPVDVQVDFIKGGSDIKIHSLCTEIVPRPLKKGYKSFCDTRKMARIKRNREQKRKSCKNGIKRRGFVLYQLRKSFQINRYGGQFSLE